MKQWIRWGIFVILIAGIFLVIWHNGGKQKHSPVFSAYPATPMRKATGFELVGKIFKEGGSTREIEEAIGWLDEHWRLKEELPAGKRETLLRWMNGPIPKGMDKADWHHLYNSSCNTMTAGGIRPDEGFLDLLEKDAVEGRDQVTKLYALQHLGRHRTMMGKDRQKSVLRILEKILANPKSNTVGTALVLKSNWDGNRIVAEEESFAHTTFTIEQSLKIASDQSRSTDIRSTALMVAGDFPECLELCREIAGNREEHMLLRKAAMRLIGRHGSGEDETLLETSIRENPRLAQAAGPALASLRRRLAGKDEPVVEPIFEPSGVPGR